jgi:para-aminobenzoate synthetase component 1
MRVVPLALRRDPLEVLASLAAERGAFLLEVPERGLTLLGCAPRARLRLLADGSVERDGISRTCTDPLHALEQFVREAPAGVPFPLGSVVGYLAYELGRFTEPQAMSSAPAPDVPLAVLSRYDPVLVYDRGRGQYALACQEPDAARAPWLERLAAPAPVWDAPLAGGPLGPNGTPERYRSAVERVLAYLAAGDAYQVNLTQPYTARLGAPAWALFARLAPAPFSAYLDVGDAAIVASSPELFLRRRGPLVETHPIKGTRPRGEGRARDVALAAELESDAKERAEHVMIVDLERNDLGRVAVPGSVAVPSFARVESHPTVHHLVSSVTARLQADVGLADLLRATFPGGSITGAPKVRAMQIIAEIEEAARGVYTGAYGLFHPGGDLELALAIRTAVVLRGVVRYGAGGGIVADSRPERELAEAWLKTAVLRQALDDETPVRHADPRSQCSSG